MKYAVDKNNTSGGTAWRFGAALSPNGLMEMFTGETAKAFAGIEILKLPKVTEEAELLL
jgi:hypothetical protein